MAGETTLTIIGNLTGDPDLKFLESGTALCRFTIASTPRFLDRQTGGWKDGEALFLRCTAWRQLAENITESLSKGTRVMVTGRLRQSTWETPDGEKRSAIDLDVDEIGPSLRFATATVNRATRGTGRTARDLPTGDPWETGTPARGNTTAEPPF